MPKRARETSAVVATNKDYLADAPKPWAIVKPKGLFIVPDGVRLRTAEAVWDFFNTPDFPWFQRFGVRFPKTAKFNNYRIGPFMGDDEQRAFEDKYPAVYQMCQEAVAAMRAHLEAKEPDSSFKHFKAESVNVHKHEPGWGLGAHYDDTHDVGHGMVLMASISKDQLHLPRKFMFTDPVRGRKYEVFTPNRQVLLFKDACYDFWRHESIRDKHQSGTCLSFTIRLKSIDGYNNFADDRKYPKGAPAAAMWAHKRIRAGRAIIRAWRRLCARRRVATAAAIVASAQHGHKCAAGE